jgi:hypothetical protein
VQRADVMWGAAPFGFKGAGFDSSCFVLLNISHFFIFERINADVSSLPKSKRGTTTGFGRSQGTACVPASPRNRQEEICVANEREYGRRGLRMTDRTRRTVNTRTLKPEGCGTPAYARLQPEVIREWYASAMSVRQEGNHSCATRQVGV